MAGVRLLDLPVEVTLHIISYLRIPDIHKLQLVSHSWNDFITGHESPVYRDAALLHNFAAPNATPLNARGNYAGAWLDDLAGWKDLCRRWYEVEKNWEGLGSSARSGLVLTAMGSDLHRFKIDEEQRTVIGTLKHGGMIVAALNTDQMLWHLSSNYVRPHAHCEFSSGFLIFDRLHPHALEVWRRTRDYDPSTVPTSFAPVQSQLYVAEIARQTASDISVAQGGRGQFMPWALLTTPKRLRAYRFVYPTLLVGSEEGQEVFLFDIPSSTLTQRISFNELSLPVDDLLSEIMYVELGVQHVFVCSAYVLAIISRSDPPPGRRRDAVLFPTPDMRLDNREIAKERALQILHESAADDAVVRRVTIHLPEPTPTHAMALIPMSRSPAQHVFTAVHVDSVGRDLAAVTATGVLFLVHDFDRAFRNDVNFDEITTSINLDDVADYLAFEHGRVIVQTSRGMIYVVSLDATFHSIYNPANSFIRTPRPVWSFPHLRMHRLTNFYQEAMLTRVCCLQATKTGVFVSWNRSSFIQQVDFHEAFAGRSRLYFVDFSPISRI